MRKNGLTSFSESNESVLEGNWESGELCVANRARIAQEFDHLQFGRFSSETPATVT